MIGLRAIATSGDWTIQIDSIYEDETEPGVDSLGITIDHPRLYVQSTLDDPQALWQLLSLLRAPPERSGEIVLGKSFAATLRVLVSTRGIKFKWMNDGAPAGGYPAMIEVRFESAEASALLETIGSLCEKLH